MDLTNREIEAYLDTNEPYDKAGAYGIQGTGGLFVKKIEGCYYNIVGLPLNKLYCVLRGEYAFHFKWE
jgi:septum formation protein